MESSAPQTCAYGPRHVPAPHEIDSHHIVPQSWSGPSDPANLIDLCANCHHNTHWLINEYVRHGGKPPASILKTYTPTERYLAARAWAGRPAHPTYTLTRPSEV